MTQYEELVEAAKSTLSRWEEIVQLAKRDLGEAEEYYDMTRCALCGYCNKYHLTCPECILMGQSNRFGRRCTSDWDAFRMAIQAPHETVAYAGLLLAAQRLLATIRTAYDKLLADGGGELTTLTAHPNTRHTPTNIVVDDVEADCG